VDNKDGDYQKHASTTSTNKAGGKTRHKEDKAETDATKPARKGDKSRQMETERRRSHAGKQMSTKKITGNRPKELTPCKSYRRQMRGK